MPVPPTQEDIARALGVSKMTVSLALRNSPEVSREMRAKVAATAAEMGYRSNPYVRGFIVHQRHRRPSPQRLPIALLNLWNPPARFRELVWSGQLMAGAGSRAEELGYYIDEIAVRAPGMTARRVNSILCNRGIRGILIAPTPHSYSHLTLDWDNFAGIAVGLTLRKPNLHRIALNTTLSIQLALHHLKNAGYQRIGFLLNRTFVQRMNGDPESAFLYQQSNLPPKKRIPIHWSAWYNFQRGFPEWLEKYKPDAIITYWGNVLEWLIDHGCKVPDDLGFVHLNVGLSQEQTRRLSGVSDENREIGRRAVELLVSEMERNSYGVPASPTITLVTPCWVPGETTRRKKIRLLRT